MSLYMYEINTYKVAFYDWNKANLRDWIAATGLVILLQSDSNRRCFSPCDLEIWQMTFKNNRAHFLCYFKLCASFLHFVAIGEFKLELQSGNAQLRMTFKNNSAPFLSNIKLCASFHHHMWIQTGVTVRKRLNWVLTSVTFTFCMDITFVNGNNSWKLNDDTMRGTLWKMCHRWTDERTDRSILRAAWSQL